MAHDPAHEDLLQQTLAGDLALDARARARLESCAECAQRWRELQDLVASIDSADRERRAVLAAAAHARPVPGSDRVARTLEAERRKTFAGRARRPSIGPPWRLAVLAAAVLVVGFFVARALFPSKPDAPDTYLGTHAIEFSSDYRRLSPGTAIRWRFASGADKGPFLVRLRGELDGRPYSNEIPVPGPEWTPTSELVSHMPSHVDLLVVAIDAFKAEVGSSREISLSVSR